MKPINDLAELIAQLHVTKSSTSHDPNGLIITVMLAGLQVTVCPQLYTMKA